jgi:hypothetical protein
MFTFFSGDDAGTEYITKTRVRPRSMTKSIAQADVAC